MDMQKLRVPAKESHSVRPIQVFIQRPDALVDQRNGDIQATGNSESNQRYECHHKALNAQIDTKPIFAEKTKDDDAVPAQAATKTALLDTPVTWDLSKILTVTKTNTYESSVAIEKNFAKNFLLKWLVLAFHTVWGNVDLGFFTKNEVEEVFTS